MRKRTNRIAVRLSDAELKRLNDMATKTVLAGSNSSVPCWRVTRSGRRRLRR